MTQPDNYQHNTRITVRFADLDVLGHLNHAKYLTYMEHARILYLRDVCGFSDKWTEFGVILANITCDYQKPVAFADEVTIYTRCSRIGGKSFDLEYVLQNDMGETVATGKTVLVAYDYTQDTTMTIPQVWRDQMTDFETIL